MKKSEFDKREYAEDLLELIRNATPPHALAYTPILLFFYVMVLGNAAGERRKTI